MKFEELYKLCAKKRDEVRYRGYKNKVHDVLKQLLNCCFFNDLHPDELPQTFNLYQIDFHTKEIKKFLEDLMKIEDINVDLIKNDFVKGNTFEITLPN